MRDDGMQGELIGHRVLGKPDYWGRCLLGGKLRREPN